MKKIYLLSTLFVVAFAFSQTKKTKFNNLVESERKSASKFTNLIVNPNTQNYDITYHQLEFTVNPAVYFINGKITTTFTALANMSTITFDMANELTVSNVKKNGVNLTFTESGNNELVITLPSTITAGTSATLEVTYSGAPPVNGFDAFSSNVHNGAPIIYTLSEPYGARDWWPCKQDLNDKINSIDVYITAPSQYIAVSNGIETTTPVINGANKTTHFHHGYAIPAYLICMAVTNYSVYNQVGGTAPNTYPIVNYLYPETLASVTPQLDQTPLILNLYENLFEIYPFHNEKYGHAQFGWGGGMEHTTVSFMVGFDRQLIAHEMAHQWFGDKITCGTWKDIWLNEGFATYVASMVIENFDGVDAFISDKTDMVDYITSNPNGNVYLTDAQATNVNRIFSGRLTYDKGAMVLEMLRFKMGDAMFFQAIKNYLADTNLAYGYATTANLQAHLETVYGSSLTEFFNDWIYNQGFPSYDVIAEGIGGDQVRFTLNQTQSNTSVSFFEMPVPITVYGFNGEVLDIVLNNTTNGQQFIETVPFPISDVVFDPSKHLISNNNTVTLGKENFEVNNSVKLYPNPVSNELYIKLPTNVTLEKITVFNSMGQKVMGSNSGTIFVNNLSDGVYQIVVETTEGTFHKKFIKK